MVLLGPKLCFENEFITFGLFLFTEEYIELLEKTFIIRLLKEIGRQKSLRQFINHLYCVCVCFFSTFSCLARVQGSVEWFPLGRT